MMMANLFLKPHLHLLPFPSKLQFVFPHTHKYSISLPTTTSTFSIPHFSTTTLCYGPSLQKGTNPSQSQIPHDQNDVIFHEDIFTRVFDLAALRVPSAECSALESRLRGHLLNWPRIRNIARVPGDDVDPDLAPLLGHQNNGGGDDGEEQEETKSLVSLQRQSEGDGDVLSPVLYREKLAKTFNTRGFVKFRNLAKISRPSRNKKKKKKKEKEKVVGVEGKKSVAKNTFSAVEVVEEGVVDEGLRNLLGEECGRTKWRGSTRLLLLDERYAGRGVEELPEAIKVPFCEFSVPMHSFSISIFLSAICFCFVFWNGK